MKLLLDYKHVSRCLCRMFVRTKPKRPKFKAGGFGGHVGVKFKLASAGLQRIRRKQDKEDERKAAEFHRLRMGMK